MASNGVKKEPLSDVEDASSHVAGASGHDRISQILARIERDELGLVQGADLLEKALEDKTLLYTMEINPRQVGFDPCNRDGCGGNYQEVHLLLRDIAFAGWSWPAVAHATCVEILPGDKTVENFNKMLCDGQALAPVVDNEIHFGSLSCGHTNMGLRALQAGVKSDCSLLSRDGFLDLAKVEARDPEMATAVRRGLKWKVLKATVRTQWPRALSVLQAARNVSFNRQTTEVQGLALMHGMAASQQGSGSEVNWAEIRRAVLRSRPPWAENVDHLIAFLATRSGGVKGGHLREYEAFHRQFVNPSKREPPGAVYGAAADFPRQYTALALLKTAYTCPPDKLKNRQCAWVSESELRNLAKSSDPDTVERLRLAEAILSDARAKLLKPGVVGEEAEEGIHRNNTLV